MTYLAYLYMLHAGLPETCARQTVPARSTPQVGLTHVTRLPYLYMVHVGLQETCGGQTLLTCFSTEVSEMHGKCGPVKSDQH